MLGAEGHDVEFVFVVSRIFWVLFLFVGGRDNYSVCVREREEERERKREREGGRETERRREREIACTRRHALDDSKRRRQTNKGLAQDGAQQRKRDSELPRQKVC